MGQSKIVAVRVVPGCISCGTCEAICPGVFKLDGISQVRDDADFDQYEDCIREAAEICPVSVIEVEEGEGKPDAVV